MKIVGECRMCKKNAKLVKSHIIPEWAYKPIYDEKHRLFSVSSDLLNPISVSSSGVYDRILCQACENMLQSWDEYGRAIVYSRPGQPTFGIECENAGGGVRMHGVDFKRLKLFQMSVLWRAVVSDRLNFDELYIGLYEPYLRSFLQADDMPPWSAFGCVMEAVRLSEKELFHHIIPKPFVRSFKGWNMAVLFFAGTLWTFIVALDGSKCPASEGFLKPGQSLYVRLKLLKDVPFLIKEVEEFQRRFRNSDFR